MLRFGGDVGAPALPSLLSAGLGHVQGPCGRRSILGALLQRRPISSLEVFQWKPRCRMPGITTGFFFPLNLEQAKYSENICGEYLVVFSYVSTLAVSMAL